MIGYGTPARRRVKVDRRIARAHLRIGRETALRLDASYRISARLSVDFGAQYSDLADGLTPTRYFNTLAAGPAAAHSDLIVRYPLGTAFTGAGGSNEGSGISINTAF